MNENKNFKPVVPAHKKLPEFTPVSLMLGLLRQWFLEQPMHISDCVLE